MHDMPHTIEARRKISESLNKSKNVGRPKGMIISEETRQKMSQSKIGAYNKRLHRNIARIAFKKIFPMSEKTYGNKYNAIYQDKKIQIKGSTQNEKGRWYFNVRKNANCDTFALFAYDNVHDANLIHLWMVPAKILQHLSVVAISKGSFYKFEDYEINLEGYHG